MKEIKTLDDLISQCSLQERLLVEKAISLSKETEFKKEITELKREKQEARYLFLMLMSDYGYKNFVSQADFNNWKKRKFEALAAQGLSVMDVDVNKMDITFLR